tara:strand:- start:1058 stop:1201 length:144 start_codon:yes stop_codon:yes gene_type:complete
MIKVLLLTSLLNVGDVIAMPPKPFKYEFRRKRGKSNKGRRRGGNGLR